MTTTALFRPVGLFELALCWDLGMRAFPPRLPSQPIFYPVLAKEYAQTIARDWNTHDKKSGFAGFVTRFAVSTSYLSRFEPHTVGSSEHVEYWIPANDLTSFNSRIEGFICVEEGFFGCGFKGRIPGKFGLRRKDAVTQFVTLAKTSDYSGMDFTCEVSTNRKAVFLNFLFWTQHDFTKLGIDSDGKSTLVNRIRQAWQSNQIEIPLPGP